MTPLPAEFITRFEALDVSEGTETHAFKLLKPFKVYSAVLGAIIIVPANFRFDGESIPESLRWLVPPFGLSKRGACVHDYLYRNHGYVAYGLFHAVTRSQADAVYHELVLAKGLPAWRATVRWAVLRAVGWWSWNRE